VFDDQIKSTPLTITAFASPLFSLPLGNEAVKWTVWLSKEKIWKRFSTLSQIAVLDGRSLDVSANFLSVCFLFCLVPDEFQIQGHIRTRHILPRISRNMFCLSSNLFPGSISLCWIENHKLRLGYNQTSALDYQPLDSAHSACGFVSHSSLSV
jgi:hypothetical protein